MDRIRILIADDHPVFRYGLRALLAAEPDAELLGEASTGDEAVAQAATLQPDVVLMDLNMPVLDGFNATLRIREYERTRDVPVVAVTAYDSAESRAAAGAVGCCDYVVKPLDLEHLSTLLRRFLPARAAAKSDA